jgi:glycerophosphoryl diester phosphodiesterase
MKKNTIKLLSTAAFAAALFFTASDSQAADGRAVELMKADRPIVVAHRGFSMYAPENTIPSFMWGKWAAADMVELDFYTSKDGVLFCLHDGNLNRTTDVKEKFDIENTALGNLTSEQLRQLDAGKWKAPIYKGTPLPTLEEALTAIQADGGITLAEHKIGSAEQCAAVLKKLDCVNDLVVQSFNWNFLADMQKVLPEQITVALGPIGTRDGVKVPKEKLALDKEWVDSMLKLNVKGAAWDSRVTKEGIEYAHEKGLKVFVYTIDNMQKAQELLDMGVDAIITNNPALIWKAIALKK